MSEHYSDIPDPAAGGLQEALDRLRAGETIEDVASGLGADGAALVHLAAQLHDALPSSAAPAFKARLRAHLQEQMAATGHRRRAFGWLTPRLLPRLAALVAASGLVAASAAVAAADALPGSALYGVKLAAEETRVLLTVDPAARVMVRLRHADVRLSEIMALIDRGIVVPPSLIEALLRGYDTALADARGEGDALLVEMVLRDGAATAEVLKELAGRAPAVSRSLLVEASRRLSGGEPAQARPPGPATAVAEPPGLPKATVWLAEATATLSGAVTATLTPGARGAEPTATIGRPVATPSPDPLDPPAAPATVVGATEAPPQTTEGPPPVNHVATERARELAARTATAAAQPPDVPVDPPTALPTAEERPGAPGEPTLTPVAPGRGDSPDPAP